MASSPQIDIKLLAGLGRDETSRMVRVPVAPAKWSTWKRFGDSAGISMGHAIAALIDREPAAVFGDSSGKAVPMFERKARQHLADRVAAFTRREQALGTIEQRMRRWSEYLRRRQHKFEVGERRPRGSDGASHAALVVAPSRRDQWRWAGQRHGVASGASGSSVERASAFGGYRTVVTAARFEQGRDYCCDW